MGMVLDGILKLVASRSDMHATKSVHLNTSIVEALETGLFITKSQLLNTDIG